MTFRDRVAATLGTTLVAALVTVGSLAAANPTPSTQEPVASAAGHITAPQPVVRDIHVHRVHPTRKPCRFEDGPGPCFWDAGVRGNGHGRSFWIDAHGWTHYVDGRVLPPRGESHGGHPHHDHERG